MNLKNNRFVGLGMIACVGSAAGLVAANPCFQNVQKNTCTQLPPPPAGRCWITHSNNHCHVGVPAQTGLSSIGQPTQQTCVYEEGKQYAWGCASEGLASQTTTLDCSPATGTACPGGGGGDD